MLIYFIAYLVVVRFLRYRRRDCVGEVKTAEDARAKIVSVLADFEFNFIYGEALELALFRTYGIPSISKLLVETGELCSKKRSGKRAEDTSVIIGEILHNPVDSERFNGALNRMNWMHNLYRNKGKIGNGEMLYTLLQFHLQPILYIDRYEWRTTTNVEKNGSWLFWKEIGQRMGISDLPKSHDEAVKVMMRYEDENMRCSESNVILASRTLDLMLNRTPNWMRPMAVCCIESLIDERLRRAVGFADAPTCIQYLVDGIFLVRKFVIRCLMLPRFSSGYHPYTVEQSGKITRSEYLFEPFYVKPTFWNKVKARLLGVPAPGPGYYPDGFCPHVIGPKKLLSKTGDGLHSESCES